MAWSLYVPLPSGRPLVPGSWLVRIWAPQPQLLLGYPGKDVATSGRTLGTRTALPRYTSPVAEELTKQCGSVTLAASPASVHGRGDLRYSRRWICHSRPKTTRSSRKPADRDQGRSLACHRGLEYANGLLHVFDSTYQAGVTGPARRRKVVRHRCAVSRGGYALPSCSIK
jgi:hypothetical protein